VHRRRRAGVASAGRPVFLKMVYHGPQAIEEDLKLLFLIFEPPQRVGAIFIEGIIAA
jgi:hypothetical protein